MHGIHSHGFPNLFISGMNQGANLISNITHNLVEAGATIAAVVAEAERRGATYVEVTKAAEQAWISAIEQPGASLVGGPDCTPGYYNNEGQAMGRREHLNMSGFPGGPVAYFDYINRWRTDGEFAGLAFAKVETDA